MKNIKYSLKQQLVVIIFIILLIVTCFLGYLLPKVFLPIYEKNIYDSLRQPLSLISRNVTTSSGSMHTGFIMVEPSNISVSINLQEIIKYDNIEDILIKVRNESGKFKYKGRTYYYNSININDSLRIALTDDTYLISMKRDISNRVVPIILVVIFFISMILILWVRTIINKINNIKKQINGISSKKVSKMEDPILDDELNELRLAINNATFLLQKQDNYRNELYQSISHDFKTPITVIKSYTEAALDEAVEINKALSVIDEQTNKLEDKVKTLLHLNKLEYLKESNDQKYDAISIKPLILSSIEKFKYRNKDLEFNLKYNDGVTFYGNDDLWESIIDNILSNFIRYAKKEIKIDVTKDKIVLFNDGPKIDENVLNNIFTAYKKGVNGEFGLGLSIVKKSIELLSYKIEVKNVKNGVKFIILKK